MENQEDKEYKTATAETTLEVHVNCPHCGSYLEQTDILREHLEDDLRAEDIDVEITCEDCNEMFYVTRISY